MALVFFWFLRIRLSEVTPGASAARRRTHAHTHRHPHNRSILARRCALKLLPSVRTAMQRSCCYREVPPPASDDPVRFVGWFAFSARGVRFRGCFWTVCTRRGGVLASVFCFLYLQCLLCASPCPPRCSWLHFCPMRFFFVLL